MAFYIRHTSRVQTKGTTAATSTTDTVNVTQNRGVRQTTRTLPDSTETTLLPTRTTTESEPERVTTVAEPERSTTETAAPATVETAENATQSQTTTVIEDGGGAVSFKVKLLNPQAAATPPTPICPP